MANYFGLVTIGLLVAFSAEAGEPSGMTDRVDWPPFAARLPAAGAEKALRSMQVELPGQEQNRLKKSMPGIGCWFWVVPDFEPEGYKAFIDSYARHSNLRLISASIRHPRWVTDPAVHDQIKAAAEYARQHDMGLAFDLDIRLAREAFRQRYPEDQQEIVRMREVRLESAKTVSLAIEGVTLGDHYTFKAPESYVCTASRLLRVYSYGNVKSPGLPADVRDITHRCKVEQADGKALRVSIPCTAEDEGRKACVLAAFTLLTPDVFSPHVPEFEKQILQQYADVPLAGACKDEWGFPGRFTPKTSELWYSEAMAKAYAGLRPGHDLARDLFLMFQGENGREAERAAAINHYMRMYWQQCADVESRYYDSIKEVFGDQAMSMTHPTWFPYPNEREIFKNGLDWWAVKRDLAQTDENTPFCIRTALAKKWQSPLWYNMFYSNAAGNYRTELWSDVLGGGRINYHQLFPAPRWWSDPHWNNGLLKGGLMQAEARVQLLNYISTQPIDCPVAVIFGHASALNWAGPGFADVGMKVADKLWESGYYADLIPTSEIGSGALRIAEDGSVQYGPQRYAAAVLYNPEYEAPATAEFFTKAAAGGKTRLFRTGVWSRDFEGKPLGPAVALPAGVTSLEASELAPAVIAFLQTRGVEPHAPCVSRKGDFGHFMAPPTTGRMRLLDGTVIHSAGTDQMTGDPIRKVIRVGGHEADVDAIGVAGVRFDESGKLQALAAGGLKSFVGGGVKIELPERIDIALWKDKAGAWRGILQGYQGAVPEDLAKLCRNWIRLRVPEPLE